MSRIAEAFRSGQVPGVKVGAGFQAVSSDVDALLGDAGTVEPPLHQPLANPQDPSAVTFASVARQETGRALSERLVTSPGLDKVAVEQYRKLASVLCNAQVERGVEVVQVVSALPGEGKTLTAANLALTLSESFQQRVLLVDADLRQPALHRLLALSDTPGYTDPVRGGLSDTVPVIELSPCLSVLLAVQPDPQPVGTLSSERMARMISSARVRFEWVILDTPPAALVPDVSLLSRYADGALLVVRAGVTPYPSIARALDALGRDHVLGVVMNRTEIPETQYYGYYARQSDLP